MSWLSEMTGIHISPQHGIHIDPKTILTNAMALTGNPWAIAGSIGNDIHAISPNSTLGKLGSTAQTVGSIGGGLTGGISALGSLPGVSSIPGATSILSALGGSGEANAPSGAASAIPDSALGIDAATNAATAAGGGSGGILGSLEGLAGKAGGFLTGNGGKNALGIAQGINAALQQKQANDYAKQALGSIEGSYNQRAPLRAQGISSMLASQKGNPYATGTPNTAPVSPYGGY